LREFLGHQHEKIFRKMWNREVLRLNSG